MLDSYCYCAYKMEHAPIAIKQYSVTDVLVIMYDISNSKSLVKLKCWIEEGIKYCSAHTPFLLVANKIDLAEDGNETNSYLSTIESVRRLFFDINFFSPNRKIFWTCTSCKNGKGLTTLLSDLLSRLIENIILNRSEEFLEVDHSSTKVVPSFNPSPKMEPASIVLKKEKDYENNEKCNIF